MLNRRGKRVDSACDIMAMERMKKPMRARKRIKTALSLVTALALALSMVSPVLAVTYSAAATISESVTTSGQTYSSETALQNAILVTAGTSTLTNPTVTKSGSPSGSSDDYDFYGTNAAIVATGGTLNISGGTVTTSGAYANAVYAHDEGVINVTGTEITTSAHNSGGVMVTGGGTLNATNVTVTTSEGSSAAIRSDKGGGTLKVEGGSFTTSGQGSPAIYSTADITVNNATLTSTHSEGIVVEGGNSVSLDGVTLTDTNDTLNGQSTTYKNIFLYQSMSGDASSGSSTFSATDSTITTNVGDTFYATNITTTITLKNNTITNKNSDSSKGGYFLRAQADSWGTSGSNGGDVTLNLSNQTAAGDIYIDGVSTLKMNLSDSSSYAGTINGGNTASSIALTLDAGSTLSLTGNSYVTSLKNSDSDNSNITLNGYSLYVNGTAITVSDSGANTETLTFTDSSNYDIPASTVGTAITEIDVSGGVSGGTSPYTFTATNLPAGVSMTTAGVISGTPTAAADASTATIIVTDSASATASIQISVGAVTASDTGDDSSGTDSYNLSENPTITIDSDGSYTITGSATDGCITVDSGKTVTLTLSDVTLTSTTEGYAPVICKANSVVTLVIDGTVTLTDNEDANASNPEGAAIKVKSGASLKIQGDGTLNVYGKCKNGVKGGATSTITVTDSVKLNILEAANNGLAADGSVIIKGGTLDITATNDGIKASPDDGDTASAGTITIYDGDITIDAQSDGINAAGDITIYGGDFTINAQSDGIQTDSNLTISDGTFNIKTLNGYDSGSAFVSDTMSCKGLKASSGSGEDTTADSTATNTITITGGTFTLNTADDAIHSDAYIEITGGKFTIQTGDDGAHADTSLILGTSGGAVARDPDMTINNSYEGLEAGTVYVYSGRYYVRASDDGINAAGGSSDGTDPGAGGGNNFNPGGGGPGGRLMSIGGFDGARLLATSDYSLNIMGGNVYVNADGDGLDSNGALTLTGGNIEVWGQSSGDNEPMDYDGTLTVKGATIFAAGCAGMGAASPSNGSQSYVSYGGTSGGFGGGPGGGNSSGNSASISSGALISVTNGSSTIYQANAPKAVSYVFFSSPDTTSSYSISSGSGSVSCHYGNDWTHSWNSGVVTTAATESASGLRTYACSVCGATETETIPQLVSIPEDEDDSGDDEEDTGYAITFVTDDNCSVNVYYTQKYEDGDTTPDATDVTSTVSYNADTGKPDSSGDGQINFTVVLSDGYTVTKENIAIDGTYNKLKEPSDTGLENTWRITKIQSALTVTITPESSGTDTTTVTGITVKTAPTKTSYMVGDTFDPTGLVLTATYSDASAADVTYGTDSGITFSGFDSSTAGTKTITATYEEQTATFTVTVVETQSEIISISAPVANTGLKYTGNEQTGVPSGTGYTLGGTYAATNVGDYTATATLNDGYAWTDGTSEVKEISWSIARADGPSAPTGLSGVAPTTENGSNGQITGTSTDMEYSASVAFSGASDCSANTTTGLSAGTYYVRYKQTATTEAGAAVAVTVPAYSSSGGSGNSGSGDSSASGGCYVATSVYGSYDCPEVWTLRRFRDNVLAETWYGRLFIRAYYAVSPTAVKLFGDSAWFQNFWRGQLDNLVSNLQADGFESTPYEDQSW